jgi:hypothetical protein
MLNDNVTFLSKISVMLNQLIITYSDESKIIFNLQIPLFHYKLWFPTETEHNCPFFTPIITTTRLCVFSSYTSVEICLSKASFVD